MITAFQSLFHIRNVATGSGGLSGPAADDAGAVARSARPAAAARESKKHLDPAFRSSALLTVQRLVSTAAVVTAVCPMMRRFAPCGALTRP